MKNVFVWLFFMQASFLFSVPQADYSGEFKNVSAGDIIFRVSYNNHPSIYGPRVIYPGYRDRFLSSRGGTITKEYFTAAMKNLAASSGVSSVEKKKSYGLFSFYTGGLYPAIIG
jgi:hypothetical protein